MLTNPQIKGSVWLNKKCLPEDDSLKGQNAV
jgi:hypothetical protein